MQNLAHNQVQNLVQITPQFAPDLEKGRKKCLKQHQPVKLRHFVQKMKKNTLKDGLDAKKDAKRDAKSSFCCSEVISRVFLKSMGSQGGQIKTRQNRWQQNPVISVSFFFLFCVQTIFQCIFLHFLDKMAQFHGLVLFQAFFSSLF